jgi:hypothetical protein
MIKKRDPCSYGTMKHPSNAATSLKRKRKSSTLAWLTNKAMTQA